MVLILVVASSLKKKQSFSCRKATTFVYIRQETCQKGNLITKYFSLIIF